MKPIALVSLIVCLLFSCEKNNSPTANYTFPITLKLVGVTKNSDVLVYTNGMQITDENVIKQFSYTQYPGETPPSTVFNLSLNANDYQTKNYDTIRFLSKDTLLMGSKQTSKIEWMDPVQKYSVTQNDQKFSFYSKYLYDVVDTTSSALFTYFDPKTNIFYSNGGIIPPIKLVMTAQGNFDEITFSCISYKLKENHNGGNYLAQGYPIFNGFNPQIIKHLQSRDTLAVQNYSFIYKKVN